MNENIKKDVTISIPNYALSVMKALEAAGEEVYIVGGCVRDALLGKKPHDYDMTVSCEPQRTMDTLSDFRTIATGIAHGTVTAISEGRPIEITTFRVDGSYTDMRRPDSVSFTRNISDDLSRRDFTVNAMAYSPKSGLIDLFGGADDLKKGLLRAVGEPEKRFGEDALRIMRAFRFSAQLGFEIEESTLAAAEKCKAGLAKIAKERISSEFVRLICSPYPEKPLLQMIELGILDYVTPGYAPSKKILSLLSQMPCDDLSRLGFFLAESDREGVCAIASHLKLSNKQKSGAAAISENAKTVIQRSRDATLLRSRIGEYAQLAARASALLGYSNEKAITLVEGDRSPCRISDLEINGKELSMLGFSGKEIGELLEYLLDKVIEEPKINTKEQLTELAKNKKRNKNA